MYVTSKLIESLCNRIDNNHWNNEIESIKEDRWHGNH